MSGYLTIEGSAKAEIVEKKSRFIAHLAHVSTEEEALGFLGSIRSEHIQARHNVYAYILHSGRTRYSDDGEPAQTSGMPTYDVLAHAGLEDVICVTTRYFGGTLLGTGGLVRAYTSACQEAIKCAHIVSIAKCIDTMIDVAYDLYPCIEKLIRDERLHVIKTDYSDKVSLTIRCEADEAPDLARRITDMTSGRASLSHSEPKEAVL